MTKSTFLFYFILSCSFLYGQNEIKVEDTTSTNDKNLKIYFDCSFCDQSYFKQNLTHVEFVRDRKVADVHLLFTKQRNGSGGSTQRIQFLGLNEFEHLTDTLSYSVDVNMTSNEKREKQLRYVNFGLMRFWIEMGAVDDLELMVSSNKDSVPPKNKDKWDFWVFGLNAGGWFNGQETSSNFNTNASISAKRITEKNKFSLRGSYNKNFQKYDYDGIVTTANQQNSWAFVQDVISINDHWSYGFFGSAGNSIFGNYKLYAEPKAGIEYDFFSYSESFAKQVIIGYSVGARYNNYYDTTVFNKTEETVAFHEVIVGGSLNQNWGSLNGSVTYQNYLHDFELNSFSFRLNLRMRLFKGFSWNINGNFNILHNQINLEKSGASLEDVLLQQQQLGTGYSYWMNTGINYSFGSIYNSVVNPRFDF